MLSRLLHVVGWMGASAALLACATPILGIVSGDERSQIALVRGVKNTLSPATNRPLGVAIREAARLMGAGLPTRYGLELRDYTRPMAWPTPISSGGQIQVVSNPSTGELARLFLPSGLLQVDFEVKTPSQETVTYAVSATRTPLGAAGRLDILVSGSNWGPAAGASPPFLNRGFAPQVPAAVQVDAQLGSLPQGAGQASAQVRLGNFQGSGTPPVPQQVSCTFSLASLTGQLTGAYSADLASIRLNGTTSFRLDRGNEDFATLFTSERGGETVRVELTSARLKVKLEIQSENGRIRGVAKATEWRFLELATLSQEAGKPLVIRYADGTQETVSLELPGI